MATSEAVKQPKKPGKKPNNRSTVSAIFEILTFAGSTEAGNAEAIQKLYKLNPSKNVVRMALLKLTKAGQKQHTETLMHAAEKLGFSFRGTTYVVGKNGRLIIPVESAFKAGSRVVVAREAGLITVRSA